MNLSQILSTATVFAGFIALSMCIMTTSLSGIGLGIVLSLFYLKLDHIYNKL